MTKVKFNDNSTITGTGYLHQFLAKSDSVVAVVEIIEVSRIVGPLTGQTLEKKLRQGEIVIVPSSSIDVCVK